MKLSRR